MYIVATGKEYRMREIPAYLYSGQTVVTEPEETMYGTFAVIVDTGSNDLYRANYVRDRIASGMFGAVVFTSRNEADAFVEDLKH
jgi:hypothetical protein